MSKISELASGIPQIFSLFLWGVRLGGLPCPAFKSSTSLLWIPILSTERLNWFGTSTREANLAAPSFETSCEERNSQPAISTMQRLDLHFFFLCSPGVINLWTFGCGAGQIWRWPLKRRHATFHSAIILENPCAHHTLRNTCVWYWMQRGVTNYHIEIFVFVFGEFCP